ncbi:sucrose-specific PTS transporter subunit IIBC [Sporolactobacillus sp. Y61]|uniref:protein-N(pi)-phosphohistidine--sucrose phosphotransferase n=1 Tax=Sporolactobacillus sp. Y61 TaxID=3160863 RepID=A0AAU8IHK9_9BACL
MQHGEVAKRVLKNLGQDNIQAAAHCATRLRLVLKDDKSIDQKALDSDPDIKGTFETDGQYQIIIGPGDVDKVYAELIKMTGLKEATTDDVKKVASQKKKNPIVSLLKVLSDIFIPIIPALVAGGLLMALYNVLTAEHLFMAKSIVEEWSGLKGFADMVNAMSAAPFTFLPILIGISATKRFGGNPYLGAVMGMIMVLPSLVNGYGVAAALEADKMKYWNVFGLKIAQAGYQGQVLPVLGVSYILANLEKFFHRYLKGAVDFTFTPMFSIIITGFLTFTIVGPALRTVGDGLTSGLVWLYNTTGWFGMGIFGLFYSAIVITGLHQMFPPIETQLLANASKTGGSFMFPVVSMANITQGAATAAIFFASKDKKQKVLASSSSISALLGITEPAIFGVNLKLKFPFFCAAIASGIGSALLGLTHVLSLSLGPAWIFGFISIRSQSIVAYMICIVVGFVLSFIFTYLYAKRAFANQPQNTAENTVFNEENTMRKADEIVVAPVSGQTQDISTVNDKVFSTAIIGKGIAIKPNSDQVVAPVTGEVTVSYPTNHAYGIRSNDGAELLIHLGIDTVNLQGKFLTSNVRQGDQVEKGQPLGTFDREKIQNAGYDTTVMVVVTNSKDYADVEPIAKQNVAVGDKLLALAVPLSNAPVATKLKLS